MNAEEAARFLGCSSKTVRRHLEKGTITASRKASGELKISDDQVEKLRLVLELEDTSRHVQPTASIGRPERADMSRQVETSIEQRLASLAQSIANLNSTIDIQSRRINELTKRVAELEARNVPMQPIPPSPTSDIIPQSKPPKRSIAPSPDLPDGAIGLSDFAAQHSISLSSASRWVRNGDIATEQRQRAGRPQHFLTIEQQEQAIEWLEKHGKLS